MLQESQRIQADQSQGFFTASGNDEISGLAQGFNGVLSTMRQAMDDLAISHRALLKAQGQINDSLHYASILQRAILPDTELVESLGQAHGLLWLPRDRVGGDFYVVHRDGERVLVGVADCAGHGVAGAMMTMLARAGIDRFIQQLGIDSPAAVLQATNAGMHLVLSEAQLSRALATSMDVGLVLLDFDAEILRFAGAKISLYWSDGETVEMVKGDNRSLWDRRTGVYQDYEMPLRRGFTYYMATDGVFDQAGGDHGFGLGTERFCQWLLDHASKPLAEQHDAFTRSISDFRGEHPQRDDITMFSFRVS
jgi:serine phosphatase RsbU (regulator of sigma subunit)